MNRSITLNEFMLSIASKEWWKGPPILWAIASPPLCCQAQNDYKKQ